MRNRIVMTFLILVFWMSLSGALKQENEQVRMIPVAKFIPGIDQLFSGKTLKGGVLLSACLATVAGAIIENRCGNRYYEQYLESTDVDEIVELRKKAEGSFHNRNYCILGICTVWLVHVLDMKLFKAKKGVIKGEAKDHSVAVGFYYFF